MFLTKHEMRELTGYAFPAKQADWLRKNGIKFMMNRLGHPLVLNKQIEAELIGTPTKSRRTGLNEQALKETIGLKD